MKGRKPLSTAVKTANGSFVKDPGRRNKREPKPKTGRPRIPINLKGDKIATAKWKQTSRILDSMGLLTIADGDLLESYCLNESMLVRCAGMIKTDIETNGRTAPAVVQWNKCSDRKIRIMAELGLTPSARTRLHAELPDEEDLLKSFLKLGTNRG